MFRETRSTVAIVLIGFVLAAALGLLISRFGSADQPTVGLKAAAMLTSPSGESMGAVTFTQTDTGVLIEAEAQGLEPGGHAIAIHSVGACTPDFSAAGDHFDPSNVERGFVHPNWDQRNSDAGGHGGDLPNIYAAADGSARADFFTNGITLQSDMDHSVFDSDGSAIVIYEKPDTYMGEHLDTGGRVACGVIQPG